MTEQATAAGTVQDSTSRALQNKIKPWQRIELCRHLAAKDMTRAALARKYGVSGSYITQFAKQHAATIDEIKSNLDDEFAGLWIAQLEKRLSAMEADYQAALSNPKADHFEWIRIRQQLLHEAAEQLGQLPSRSTLTIGGTVRHELVGVDLAECFPDAAGEGEQGGEEPAELPDNSADPVSYLE